MGTVLQASGGKSILRQMPNVVGGVEEDVFADWAIED